ncbi:hypothetical protein C9F04_26810, partial [Salmonella enterica subsp. enterica serovar Wilhelmsburg]
ELASRQNARAWGRECGKRWRGQDGGAESDTTKRQQLAAISVKFVHDNQVYRSMLSLIHFYL